MLQRNIPLVHLTFSFQVVYSWYEMPHRLLGLDLSLRRWLKRISILSVVVISPVECHRCNNGICFPALFSCWCCVQCQQTDGFSLTCYVNIWLFHTWLPVIIRSNTQSFLWVMWSRSDGWKSLNAELFLNFQRKKRKCGVHLNFSASFSCCSDVTGTQKGKINLVESLYAAECPLSVSTSLSVPLSLFKLSHLIS